MNPSVRNMKKTTPNYIVTKLLKINDKKIILKAARRKKPYSTNGNKDENSIIFLIRKKVKGENSGATSLKN